MCQLGNVAGDGFVARDGVLRSGAVPALLALLSSDRSRPSMMRNAIWAISNCVRGKPAPNWKIVGTTLPVLSLIVANGLDPEVLCDAVSPMTSLTLRAAGPMCVLTVLSLCCIVVLGSVVSVG